jgi:hypothetical protein
MIISQVTLALYFSIIMILCGVFFSAYIYNFSAQESSDQDNTGYHRAKFTHYQAGKNGSEITGTSDSMHDINELGGDANAG